MSIQLGVSKKDITPLRPISLAGFGFRKGAPFEHVHDSIHLRVFYFEQQYGSKREKALIVSADLLWWGSDRMEKIRSHLNKRWGIHRDQIILNGTHSHSGPQTSAMFPILGNMDETYIHFLEDQLFKGIEEAIDNIESVTIEKGEGISLLSINRRKLVDGEIHLAPNAEGDVDPQLQVIKFNTEKGKTKGLFVHFTVHPVVNKRNVITSEFTGIAMKILEEEHGDDIVSAFLQGCCGDVNANTTSDGKFIFHDAEGLDRMGQQFADDITTVLKQNLRVIKLGQLRSFQQHASLPYLHVPSKEEIIKKRDKGEVSQKWAELMLNEPERLISAAGLEITCIQLADELTFMGINGEVVLHYGFLIKEESEGKVIPLGYSNGMIGYLPTKNQLKEGGYEADTSYIVFSLPSPYDPVIEDKLTRTIKDSLEKAQIKTQ